MNHHLYQTEITELKRRIYEQPQDQHNGSKRLQHALMSASLYNLMPGVAVRQHGEVIKNIAFFQKWAARDQHHIGLLEAMEAVNGTPVFNAAPTIYCSFHLGSYRLLVPYLISRGLKFTLLIDAGVAAQQAADFQAVIDETRALYGKDDDCCRIIDTSRGNVMLTMLKELKRGRSLLIFIDGNSGVDGKAAAQDKLSPVSFMGQTMYSRKGVAYLAHLAQVGITPLLTYRDPDNLWSNKLEFFPEIAPRPQQEREEFVDHATQAIYTILERKLATVFEQWESWHYIEKSLALATQEARHKEINIDAISPDMPIRFNADRYLLSDLDGAQYLLLDRRSYSSNFISPGLMAFLRRLEAGAEPADRCLQADGMSAGALKVMLSKEILQFSHSKP